jgi:hypothetical protein
MSLTPLVLWYKRLTPLRRSSLFAFFFVLPVLITSLITYYLNASLDNTLQIRLLVVLVLFFIFALLRHYVETRMEGIDRVSDAQRNALGQAYASLDAIIARRMKKLHMAFLEHRNGAAPKALFEASLASTEHIQDLMTSLYEVVQSQFGQAGSLLYEIDFEATFMTRSYTDNKITICAYQNRDYRRPRSLLLRAKNPDIYDCTVTAEIYRETRPDMHIIADTLTDAYAEIYPGQRERIRSSVVYPVLSDTNEVLGTIVVHCNRSGFFKRGDADFWRKLLEIYAKRTAYEKACIDLFSGLDLMEWAGRINVEDVRPSW